MIKFENTEVMGWEHAIRGMRNPMNSWEKSDSYITDCGHFPCGDGGIPGDCSKCLGNSFSTFPVIGPNDINLMMKLCNAGSPDHRKFMRMLTVFVDITAPLYWWKEFDTYKVGTVSNSCSTMHKIAAKEFTLEDFSCEHLIDYFETDEGACHPADVLENTIMALNTCRNAYLKTKDKKYWWQMIQLLPSSYNQKRTYLLNYEVLANIYKSRRNHKLDEWSVGFMNWIKTLPYSELITGKESE